MKQIYNILAALLLVCVLGLSNQVEVFAGKPGTNSRFITISNLEKTTATVSWINGNGNGRLVVVYTGNVTQSDVDNKINDGTLYSSNSNFSATGSQVVINNGSDRAVIVYLAGGSTRTVNITGLSANTTYSVKAYEYRNDGGIDPEYLETGGTNNPVTFKTKAQPLPTKATNLASGSITDKDALASWTNGNDVDGYYMDLINYDLGQIEWEGVDIGKPNPAEFLIEGLAADTDYGYRLESYNQEGTSGYTAYHAFTTLPDATKPEMMSTEYINSNQFRLFFTEPVSFVGDVKTKFTISFYNNSNNLVSEQIIGITLEGPGNTSAICSTSVDLSTIRNGEDVTVSYQNLPSIYVKDLANNTMVTPSEILIRDWTPSKVLSSVRTKYVNPNWVTTGYGTNATTIHFLVTFDEKVKLVDANFKLDIVDGGDSNPDGTIGTITKVDLDGDGYASIYRVQCSTNVDDDCDDYSISITQNNGDDIIRDMSGNEMINTTISGPDEDYKVDRLKPSSSDNGPLNQLDKESDYSSLATQLGVTYLTGTNGADQVLDVYNLSNLNGVNPDDFVIINSAIDALDCSIEGGKVEIEYSTNGVDYNSMASYDKTIGTLDITNGYVRFMINITTLLNATNDEGKNVKFRVTTTDIGGNEVETPALAYFGSWSNATSELLYDVIAPRTPFTLTGDLFAYDYLDNDSDDDGVYFNLADNAIKTTMIKLPTIASANDNTLTGGYVEVYARRDAEEWIEFADGLTNIDAISDFNNKKFTIEDQNFINSLITSNDNLDHTIQVSFKIYDKAGNSNQYLTETLTVDRVTPNPADLSISGLAIGAINLNNTNITNLLSNDASREYFNIAAQDANKTLYFAFGIKGSSTDISLPSGKAYLEYKKSSYFAENITGITQDNWIKLAYTDNDQEPVLLTLPSIGTANYELASNTNLYQELHTVADINGDVYEFRLIPIDIADNETSEYDRMIAMASTYETIVLDNVKPKLVKAYSSDLSQFYLQEFAECGGIDLIDSDDRYFFNKNTGVVGGANDVIGATFKFEPDVTMNLPGNGVKSILQYKNGSIWTQLGPNNIYSSINLGTLDDNFGIANDGDYFVVTDWVNRQDITNIWNAFANGASLNNESDLRIQVEINDVAGNTITIIPTPTAEGDPFEESNAFIFRYDRTVPSVSVEFNNPTGCYNIGDNVQVDLTIGNNNANGNTNLTFVAESTMVNDVMLNTDCNIGQNYNDNCNANNLNGYAYGTTGNLSYTVGEGDTYRAAEEVVPFSVQVMDIAGNKSTVVTNISQNTSASQTPTIESRLHSNTFDLFKPYDAADFETKFLYGTKANNSVISQNTDYIKIKFIDLVPEHVSDIRVYYELKNNDNYTGDFNDADEYDGSFTIPAESLDVLGGKTYLVIPISQLETEYEAFANSTENQRLYIGLKFETADCNDDININCDIVDYDYIEIDRVAPKIVTYADLQEKSSNYENFANNFEVNYGTNYNQDNKYSIDDLANIGYDIFSGPVHYKFGFTNSGAPYSINKNSQVVQILPPYQSTTNHDYIGYLLMFTERMYAAEFDNYDGQSWYYADFIDKNNTKEVDNLLLIDNISDYITTAEDATADKFKYSNFGIGKGQLIDNSNDDFTDNYFAMSFVMRDVVGNAPIEMSIDYTQLVDAAGNRLLNSNGQEVTTNIPFYDGGLDGTDISAPIEVDNIAATTSSVAVYTEENTTGEEPIGTIRLGSINNSCLSTYEKTLYFEVVINDKNKIPAAVNSSSYSADYENSYVAETTNVDDKSLIYIGIKDGSSTNPNYVGYIVKKVKPSDYYVGGLEETQNRLYFAVDFSTLTEDSDEDTYYVPNPTKLNDLDKKSRFSFGVHWANGIPNDNYIAFNGNNFKLDEAGNISIENYEDFEDENSYTIDNVAPVLDYLIANSYVDQALSVNQCFTATGNGESVIVLSVSVNEKEGLCGETPHFLNANNWTVKIGEEELLPADYSVTDNINCINCIPSNNDIKTYYIRIDLKNLAGDYTFDNEGTSGEYNYSLEVTDLVGNIAVSENPLYNDKGIVSNNPLYIDNTAPELSNVVGPEGCYTNGDNFTFKVQVQDLSVAEGACLSDYTTKSNWSVSLGTGISEVVFDGEDFSIENLGEGEFEFNVMIPESTYTANSLEVINVSFADGLGNKGSVSSDNNNLVKVIANPYEIEITTTTPEFCENQTTFNINYTTNFTPTSTKLYLGTEEVNSQNFEVTGSNGSYTISINTAAVQSGLAQNNKLKLTIGSDCDNVTSSEFGATINPLPVTAGISDNDEDNTLCPNASVTFTATKDDNDENKDNYTYTWYYNTNENALVNDNSWVLISANENFELEGNTLEVTGLTTDFKVKVTRTNSITECVNATDDMSDFIDIKGELEITGITSDAPNNFPVRGSSYTYTAAVTFGDGESVNDYNYIWEYSDSATSNVTYTKQTTGLTNTFNFASNAKPGTIKVTAYSKACSTNVDDFTSSYQDILVSSATRSVTFNSVTKISMTVAWTKGNGDGKILIGNQSTLNTNSINKDYSSTPGSFTDDLVTAMGNVTSNGSFTNGSNSFSTGILRSTGSGVLNYRFLLDDNDNTKDNQAITGLTSNTRYNFRVLDYVNYPSGAPRARLYSGNTNSASRVTQAKEGEDNVGNTENTISLISPNPAKDNIAFTMNLVDTYPVTIELFSAEGRKVLVFKSNEIMSAGEHFINIPLGDLTAGYYSIVIGYGDEFILDSFIVMP